MMAPAHKLLSYSAIRTTWDFPKLRVRKLKLRIPVLFSPFYLRSDSAPTQVINISPGTKVIKIDLNAVKWQRVESSKLSL